MFVNSLPFSTFRGDDIMNYPVVKGAAYALIQANDMLVHHGTTQTSERRKNIDSEHLQNLPKHFRSFEAAETSPKPSEKCVVALMPQGLILGAFAQDRLMHLLKQLPLLKVEFTGILLFLLVVQPPNWG